MYLSTAGRHNIQHKTGMKPSNFNLFITITEPNL